jgi:vacuole morphology and inheritance protein 14
VLTELIVTLHTRMHALVLYLLQVLARICLTESEFQRVLTSIIDLFTADGRLLETRGSLIIRKLCVLLNAKSIYMALAAVLQSK